MPSARPLPGEPIASVWGGEVHDVAVKARYVVAINTVAVGVSVDTAINSVIEGDASMVAGGKIVFPVAGLYDIIMRANITGAAGQACRININNKLGAGIGATTITAVGNNQHSSTAVATRSKMAAGDTVTGNFTVQGSGGSGPLLTVEFYVRLVAYE